VSVLRAILASALERSQQLGIDDVLLSHPFRLRVRVVSPADKVFLLLRILVEAGI
jgi:hypothetical protein